MLALDEAVEVLTREAETIQRDIEDRRHGGTEKSTALMTIRAP